MSRSFRFVPTKKVTQTLLFTLAYTCSKFDVSIHEIVYMSNHFHLMMTAHTKCIPKFMLELNSLSARALNALRGTSGTNIEKGFNLLEPQDDAKLLDQVVYTLTNPCASDLVAKARQWKGVTTARMRYGQEVVVKKPRCGLWAPRSRKSSKKKRKRRDARTASKRDRSSIPQMATLRLVRPPIMPELSDDELRDLVLERVEVREGELELARREAGKKVLEMRNVMAEHWGAMPGTEDLFGVRPTVAAEDKWKRIAALQRKKVFEKAYAAARERWLGGDRGVVFPEGTWLMCCRYKAKCVGDP